MMIQINACAVQREVYSLVKNVSAQILHASCIFEWQDLRVETCSDLKNDSKFDENRVATRMGYSGAAFCFLFTSSKYDLGPNAFFFSNLSGT